MYISVNLETRGEQLLKTRQTVQRLVYPFEACLHIHSYGLQSRGLLIQTLDEHCRRLFVLRVRSYAPYLL